jgi:hypothetical protein
MAGLRSQVAWWLHGAAQTQAALEALGADLRELQHRTDRIEITLSGIERERLGDIAQLRQAVADATDDLVARVEAVRAQAKA